VSTGKFDIHRHITDQIVAMLAEATGETGVPWRILGHPVNVLTGHTYRGINILALGISAARHGYQSGTWGTYRQWAEVGAQVRKGEKATFVVFFKDVSKSRDSGSSDDDTGEGVRTRALVARASPVFAAEQVDGYCQPAVVRADPVVAHARAEELVIRSDAIIIHGGSRAYYSTTTDCIHMPSWDTFIGTETSSPTESYYTVLFHELTHWTGHETRCNRQLGKRFGPHAYAMEELVAELGAAFLCADLQITNSPRPDHAHYIASWLEVLSQDKKAIFTAASKASAAVDFLMPSQEVPRQPATATAAVRDSAQVGTTP
jgi:antirestriction protein ArdC